MAGMWRKHGINLRLEGGSAPRRRPAMSLLQVPHARPSVLLFDWHATLVDTMDAMYHAVDDVIPQLVEHGLVERPVSYTHLTLPTTPYV